MTLNHRAVAHLSRRERSDRALARDPGEGFRRGGLEPPHPECAREARTFRPLPIASRACPTCATYCATRASPGCGERSIVHAERALAPMHPWAAPPEPPQPSDIARWSDARRDRPPSLRGRSSCGVAAVQTRE